MMPDLISEGQIEQALLQRLHHQPEDDALNCYTADPEEINNGPNRAEKRNVVFSDWLRCVAVGLND